MSAADRCPNSGAILPTHAPEGLCPRCLMTQALAGSEQTLNDRGEAAGASEPEATESTNQEAGTVTAESEAIGHHAVDPGIAGDRSGLGSDA